MKISQRKIVTMNKIYNNTTHSNYKKLLNFRNTHKIKILKKARKRIEYIITKNGKKTLLLFHGAFGSAEREYKKGFSIFLINEAMCSQF